MPAEWTSAGLYLILSTLHTSVFKVSIFMKAMISDDEPIVRLIKPNAYKFKPYSGISSL